MSPWMYEAEGNPNERYDNKPGLVSKGVVLVDVTEWVCDADDYPLWRYSICIYNGKFFRWNADGRLTKANASEINHAVYELENMVKHSESLAENIIDHIKMARQRATDDYLIWKRDTDLGRILGFAEMIVFLTRIIERERSN